MKKLNINNTIRYIPPIIAIMAFIVSVGFASITSVSSIIARATVDPIIGMQILNFTWDGAHAHDGASNYETSNVDVATTGAYLPYADSEVTYRIELINLGTVETGIYQVSGLPNNLEYSFSNYENQDKICDDINTNNCTKLARRNIYITIKYKRDDNDNIIGYDSNTTTYPLTLNFDFRSFHSINYLGFSGTYRNYVIDGGNLDITFNNDDIPSLVNVTGATNNYTAPTLSLTNVCNDVSISKEYTITYVLNGGTQAANQPTSIAPGETITLLEPTREEYNFDGWYNNPDFEGQAITSLSNVTSNITLYANWTEYDYFIKHADFDGTVGNIINTGIELYSSENVNKNFRIKFTIDSYDNSYNTASNINNSSPPTILSSMVETKSPYSGFVYRVVTASGNSKYSMKINDSHVTSYLGYYNLSSGINCEIVREDGAMYAKINSNIYTKVLDYNGSIDTFNVPLTIGGNINSSGNYDRLFKGSLSNVSVEFFEGSVVNQDFSYTETRTENSYNLNGTIEFTGSNYIDTGLNLFSADNINKDFDISLTIDQFGGNANQATLINAKDESLTDSWPGFAYRAGNSNSFTLTARWPGEANANIYNAISAPKDVKISRRNGIIYYSFDGTAATNVLISTPPSSLTTTFRPNLTFGASLNSSGNPFRFFTGIVSNISVQLYDN